LDKFKTQLSIVYCSSGSVFLAVLNAEGVQLIFIFASLSRNDRWPL